MSRSVCTARISAFLSGTPEGDPRVPVSYNSFMETRTAVPPLPYTN